MIIQKYSIYTALIIALSVITQNNKYLSIINCVLPIAFVHFRNQDKVITTNKKIQLSIVLLGNIYTTLLRFYPENFDRNLVTTKLFLNVFWAGIKDIIYGRYINGVSGIMLSLLTPLPSEWGLDDNNVIKVCMEWGYILLYTIWNFIYSSQSYRYDDLFRYIFIISPPILMSMFSSSEYWFYHKTNLVTFHMFIVSLTSYFENKQTDFTEKVPIKILERFTFLILLLSMITHILFFTYETNEHEEDNTDSDIIDTNIYPI